MSTISRFSAVCQIGKLEFGGFSHGSRGSVCTFTTWSAAATAVAVISWFITFLGRGRGQMAITERWVFARRAIEQVRQEKESPKAIG